MYFNKNLKLLIKELRIHKDIIKFKNNVISNYNNTFINNGNTYFLITFNDYISSCIKKHKVNGDKIENDIIAIFNEDWRLLSLDIVKSFEPNNYI
jgi:hypothetical protein